MTAVIEARGLGKRYGTRWALTDCTLSVPSRHVVGLVGPNGAGKTTLLHLVTGLLAPTTGTIEVVGGLPAVSAAQLARVGFVSQDTPTYASFSVADHLRLGAHLNPGWDAQLAQGRIRKLGLDAGQKAGRLSGGQRAARRIDHLQPDHHPVRPRVRPARYWALRGRRPAGVQHLARHPAPPASDRLPAGQPLLGLPVVRNRDLPRARPRSGRVLHLVDPPPPPVLTSR